MVEIETVPPVSETDCPLAKETAGRVAMLPTLESVDPLASPAVSVLPLASAEVSDCPLVNETAGRVEIAAVRESVEVARFQFLDEVTVPLTGRVTPDPTPDNVTEELPPPPPDNTLTLRLPKVSVLIAR